VEYKANNLTNNKQRGLNLGGRTFC